MWYLLIFGYKDWPDMIRGPFETRKEAEEEKIHWNKAWKLEVVKQA